MWSRCAKPDLTKQSCIETTAGVYAIGLMSGTSMDAVDAAVVRFAGPDCELVFYHQFPVPPALHTALQGVGPGAPIEQVLHLDASVGALFADCALEVIRQSGLDPSRIGVIGSHGQTLLHAPGSPLRNSLQIGDPNRIAWATRITTVSDFRRMDMAAGGQGAPLATAFHAWRFRSSDRSRVVVNIGGIANVSLLPPPHAGDPVGFDTGPGNTLMDRWIQRHRGERFDRHGAWAATGTPSIGLIDVLLSDSYFAKPHPKSTGKDYFNIDWLEKRTGTMLNSLAPENVQATLLELTAVSIADAINRYGKETADVHVCGGGAHNTCLMGRLGDLLAPAKVVSTAELGIPPDAVEAIMIAWLAKCRLEGAPANLPSVTGAEAEVVLGAIYDPKGELKVKSEK